jgi:hypothetical protein
MKYAGSYILTFVMYFRMKCRQYQRNTIEVCTNMYRYRGMHNEHEELESEHLSLLGNILCRSRVRLRVGLCIVVPKKMNSRDKLNLKP